ncbi:hypothetical protein M426DRAFT_264092 [Hypoxylon sp. CI-4A]|nr:hypothetical protein M426DRAFT_264092 [Hypoxylon sp. CI-4A]
MTPHQPSQALPPPPSLIHKSNPGTPNIPHEGIEDCVNLAKFASDDPRSNKYDPCDCERCQIYDRSLWIDFKGPVNLDGAILYRIKQHLNIYGGYEFAWRGRRKGNGFVIRCHDTKTAWRILTETDGKSFPYIAPVPLLVKFHIGSQYYQPSQPQPTDIRDPMTGSSSTSRTGGYNTRSGTSLERKASRTPYPGRHPNYWAAARPQLPPPPPTMVSGGLRGKQPFSTKIWWRCPTDSSPMPLSCDLCNAQRRHVQGNRGQAGQAVPLPTQAAPVQPTLTQATPV